MERLEQPWKTVNHYLSAYGGVPSAVSYQPSAISKKPGALVVGHELIVRPKNEMFCKCGGNKMRLPLK
jgi:hypothetical protein